MEWFDDDGEIASALGPKLERTVDPEEVLHARDDLGLRNWPISNADVRRIGNKIKGAEDAQLSDDPWVKAVRQSKREAEERCRRHQGLAEEARAELFGQREPPFPDYGNALEWIEEQRRNLVPHVEFGENPFPEIPDYQPLKTPRRLLAWPNEESGGTFRCYVDKNGGPLGRLEAWSKQFATKAAIHNAQATAFILSGDMIVTESPVEVTFSLHRERKPIISVKAAAFVTQRIVADTYGKMFRRITGRARARPGPRRGP